MELSTEKKSNEFPAQENGKKKVKFKENLFSNYVCSWATRAYNWRRIRD